MPTKLPAPEWSLPGSPWSAVAQTLTRPYPVTIPMVTLMLLVPCYIFIAKRVAFGTLHAPLLPWDSAVPLQPSWALVYGALYVFLIMLPVVVVREEEHIRRTFWAYLAVWITAYVCFLVYPTVAPRPPRVVGDGFAVWGLRILYDADPPYNCFPSLHVAHSFVSALTCYRLHRRLGVVALLCASLVAVSTLFTKQHYVADVIAGVVLAFTAYVIILRGYPRQSIPELHRRLAPVLALGVLGVVSVGVIGFWIAYRLNGGA
jgi:membrane-associated phospholipid phosphatase